MSLTFSAMRHSIVLCRLARVWAKTRGYSLLDDWKSRITYIAVPVRSLLVRRSAWTHWISTILWVKLLLVKMSWDLFFKWKDASEISEVWSQKCKNFRQSEWTHWEQQFHRESGRGFLLLEKKREFSEICWPLAAKSMSLERSLVAI